MPSKPTKTPRTGRPKGGSALANPALRAIRAQAIIQARAENTPVPELARRYKCSEQTIYRYINWAKKEGLLGELQQRAVEKLAPLALDAYEGALRSNPSALTPNEVEAHKMKLGAAKEVAHGIGVFAKKSEKKVTTETESLAWYYEMREKRIQGVTEEEPVMDGEELPALPESTEEHGDEEGAEAEEGFPDDPTDSL